MINEFKEIPVNKLSLAMRKPVYGVGTNDATYQVVPRKDKQVTCPYYKVWQSMLQRCYAQEWLDKYPTYIGCSVCNEWLVFSNFKKWMQTQDWQNKQLDKDLLVKGNKEYSPNTCIFVSQKLNKLCNVSKCRRGKYKLGVSFEKASGKFKAQCSNGYKDINLGRYVIEQEAHEAYCTYKANLIKEIAEEQTDLRLKNALIERANTIHLVE